MRRQDAAEAALNDLLRLLEQRTQERDELDGQADRWTHRCVQAEERVRELEAALEHLPDNLRWAISVLEAAAPSRVEDEGHYANRALTYLYHVRDMIPKRTPW